MSISSKRGRVTAGLIVGGLSASMLVAAVGIPASAAPAKPVACAPTPGVENGTIKVGIMSGLTGVYGPTFAGFDKAVRLRFDQENAKGGVNGRKLVTETYDDMSSGAIQTNLTNKALDQDNVFGFTVASLVDTMYPLLVSRNVPVTGLRSNLAYGTYRNVFGATGVWNNDYESGATIQRMKDAGATNIAVLSHASAGGIASANAQWAVIPPMGANQALKLTDLPVGAYDATSTALRLKNSTANGVFEQVSVDGGISIANAIKQQDASNIKVQLINPLADPTVAAKNAAAFEGVIGATYGAVPPTANVRAMKTFNSAMLRAGFNPYGATAPVGWIVADEFIMGLKKAGTCPTRDGFVNGLRTVDHYNAGGMLPEYITYAPGLTPLGNPPKCLWFSVVKSGQLVADKAATCAPWINKATGQVINKA